MSASFSTRTAKQTMNVIVLDGNSLTPEQLHAIGYEKFRISISSHARERVQQGRRVVEDVITNNKVVYGINTGFGLFSKVRIAKCDLQQLQLNIIRSHSAGIGKYISKKDTRMLLTLRINVLAKGYSGISLVTLQQLIDALNANCISCVPEIGTVGASGDLAPLAHLALGLLGEGLMWNSEGTSTEPAMTVLHDNNLQPLNLKAKEGLALINGTQFITCLGIEALLRAENVCRIADVIAALSLEVLKGTVRAYAKCIHETRAHTGQQISAGVLRHLLHNSRHPSEIALSHKNCGKIQDAYTLRCAPQVHGIVHDTLQFVRGILTVEMNSATDNPMIFAKVWKNGSSADDGENEFEDDERGRYIHTHVNDHKKVIHSHPHKMAHSHENNEMQEKKECVDEIISGGNFHGEYPAKCLDYLAIAVHELGNMSERRIERLNNPDLSELPAFLVKDGGLNSGFMIAHCAAAALVSENKVLCHPSSIDSLPTSAAKEDHVSMGGYSARKALNVVSNVEYVLAIELMCAAQGIDFHHPLKTTTPLEQVYECVRSKVQKLESDRFLSPDIENIVKLIRSGAIWDCVRSFIPRKYHSHPPKYMFTVSKL